MAARTAKAKQRIEVMETFLDLTRLEGEPEPRPGKPREWLLWCRTVDGAGSVVNTFLHTIRAATLAAARRQLTAFMKGKKSTREEW